MTEFSIPSYPSYNLGLMWFRRDLRTTDNAALFQALKSCRKVVCFFIFDRAILDSLPRADRRVEFIRESLVELNQQLLNLLEATSARDLNTAQNNTAGLLVRHAYALQAVPDLAIELNANVVFFNHDDEPDALARDAAVRAVLEARGIAFHGFKDHTIFERSELLTQSTGKPYSVFTPYKNAWLKKINAFYLKPYPVERYAASLAAVPLLDDLANSSGETIPRLTSLGFEKTNLADLKIPTGTSGAMALFDDFQNRIAHYTDARNFPAIKGPSYLSVHLRFGTVSIRTLAAKALELQMSGTSPGATTWLSELIWRDFYMQVMANFPQIARGGTFKPVFDGILWEQGAQAQQLFEAWCQGRTGYPLVDAAMAQINSTGYMHNRLRMVTASFLSKDLGLDWRLGERYFAEKLNDYDWAANNGGWQWAAGTGCDAQPYFRIFNPVSQSQKFDADGVFIRRYLPVLQQLPKAVVHAPWLASPAQLQAAGVELGVNYPHPIVNHEEARKLTLARYAAAQNVNQMPDQDT